MADKFPFQEEGSGRRERYKSSWLSDLKTIGIATAGGTGPTASALISGFIPLTGQQDPVENVVHLFVKLVSAADTSQPADADATATIHTWVKPLGGDSFYRWSSNTVTPEGDGNGGTPIELVSIPHGTYRFSVPICSAGAAVRLRYMASG